MLLTACVVRSFCSARTVLDERLSKGYDMLLDVAGITVTQCLWSTNSDITSAVSSDPAALRRPSKAETRTYDPDCPAKWRKVWLGVFSKTLVCVVSLKRGSSHDKHGLTGLLPSGVGTRR